MHFLQTALTVLTLASLAGIGGLISDRARLRASLSDVRGELDDKGRQLAECKATVAEQGSTIKQQAAAIETLQAAVRGDAKLNEIGKKLDSHHEEAKDHWEADEDLLGRILQAMNRGLA